MYRFGWDSFFVRFVFACMVVFATYNAEGFSYFHWIVNNLDGLNITMAFVAVVLVICWAILIRATIGSLGLIGFSLATAFFALLSWLIIDFLALDASSAGAITYIIEFMIASVLSVGVSWAHIRRRISGQVSTDELDGEL